jgi:hypothetical protein
MGITLYLGCWMGGSIGFYFIMGLLCILGVCWGVSIVSWISCGFWVLWVCSFLWVFFCFFFMWASWVAPVYTSCVLRGTLRFFNEIFLLIKKKIYLICNLNEPSWIVVNNVLIPSVALDPMLKRSKYILAPKIVKDFLRVACLCLYKSSVSNLHFVSSLISDSRRHGLEVKLC